MSTVSSPPRVTSLDHGGEHAGTTRARHRAVVIDHDSEYGLFTADILSRECEVRLTSSARTAFGLLASRQQEVVVVEYTVPNALELIRLIRSTWPAISIVVLSRKPLLSRQVAECFKADIDDYLPAPFHPSELAARVSRMIRRAEADGWSTGAPGGAPRAIEQAAG